LYHRPKILRTGLAVLRKQQSTQAEDLIATRTVPNIYVGWATYDPKPIMPEIYCCTKVVKFHTFNKFSGPLYVSAQILKAA
jgi:hypothetical protein